MNCERRHTGHILTLLTLSMLLAAIATGSGVAATSPQKVITKTQRLSPGDAFPIPETGALVVREGSDLKVQFVPPPENRREPYKQVDLQVNDLILLVNGKRVKTIADLSKAHDETPIGAELKLGIQRDKQMMIVSFPKADPKDLPQRTMRIVTAGGEGNEILPAVGIVLSETKHSVIVKKLLPVESAVVKNLDVQEGDVVTSINGTSVSSVKKFIDLYDKLDVGAKVSWNTERKGKRIVVEFEKPKPMGPVIIRRTVK